MWLTSGTTGMVRLFTAIEIDDDARFAIAREQARIASRLGEDKRGLTFVRTQNLHLTLVFIGEVGQDQATAITAVMGVTLPQLPFRATVGELGVFPVRGAPRVLWLGLIEGTQQMIELHHRVAVRLGVTQDCTSATAFHPHLTLARWRGRRPPAHKVLAMGWRRRPVTIDVGAVTLFKSHLSAAGPSYTSLAQARLQCP